MLATAPDVTRIAQGDPAAWRLAAHTPHALHSMDRAWPETNCYVDLWIELVNAAGHDPHALLGCALAIDFEGDHWTFFKPGHADLFSLHGFAVEELDVWCELDGQLVEQVRRGRIPIVEVDAFWLPDTRGTTYRAEHGKTSIAVLAMDPAARAMRYAHNAGFFTLGAEDFDGLFAAAHAGLPPYVELVKPSRRAAPQPADVRVREALAAHVSRRPRANPIETYRARFPSDVDALMSRGMGRFHRYSFATLRQLGASHELAASLLRWINQPERADDLAAASEACDRIAHEAKTLQLKLARAVHAKRPFDASPAFDAMSAAWTAVDAVVRERFERP